MMGHTEMVKALQMAYEMNPDIFSLVEGQDCGPSTTLAQIELFNQPEMKALVMNTVLHSADVSNPCRTWAVTQAWAYALLDEYFAQGDQERMLGIPVQILNNREKLNRPNSQIGFLEFMIAPFLVTQIRLWPKVYELGENCCLNIEKWQETWVQEVQPSEDDAAKVLARTKKVQENMLDAKHRKGPGSGKTAGGK